jgi:hypothetical protein
MENLYKHVVNIYINTLSNIVKTHSRQSSKTMVEHNNHGQQSSKTMVKHRQKPSKAMVNNHQKPWSQIIKPMLRRPSKARVHVAFVARGQLFVVQLLVILVLLVLLVVFVILVL